ncbi:zf-HC2 domain-containing protein [Amycolatopsis sp.]|uniref:zf-HC2 domain-containing protein n=1 Tax=Amycolatopsis sp. TaxID=37632 RepID=UPI002D809BF2|nr:zf-HC2 domain-containing protein [Amycolatopsis sp.]HET6704982.1 zf-HC2 domain-containing protein [Amycolatopsis sp.]
MSDPYGEWDAAYVLGALSPGERREYEQHLACCGSCAAAVASFAGMPGILSVVPRETTVELLGPATLATPAMLLPGLVRAARASRRRARARVAAALAATALAGAVAGARLFAQGCSPDPRIDRTTLAPATTPSAGLGPDRPDGSPSATTGVVTSR